MNKENKEEALEIKAEDIKNIEVVDEIPADAELVEGEVVITGESEELDKKLEELGVEAKLEEVDVNKTVEELKPIYEPYQSEEDVANLIDKRQVVELVSKAKARMARQCATSISISSREVMALLGGLKADIENM